MIKTRTDAEVISCHETEAPMPKSPLVCLDCPFGRLLHTAVEVSAEVSDEQSTNEMTATIQAMHCDGPEVESSQGDCGMSFKKVCANPAVRALVQ